MNSLIDIFRCYYLYENRHLSVAGGEATPLEHRDCKFLWMLKVVIIRRCSEHIKKMKTRIELFLRLLRGKAAAVAGREATPLEHGERKCLSIYV